MIPQWLTSRISPVIILGEAGQQTEQFSEFNYVFEISLQFPIPNAEVRAEGSIRAGAALNAGTNVLKVKDQWITTITLTQAELLALPGGQGFLTALQNCILAKYAAIPPPANPPI